MSLPGMNLQSMLAEAKNLPKGAIDAAGGWAGVISGLTKAWSMFQEHRQNPSLPRVLQQTGIGREQIAKNLHLLRNPVAAGLINRFTPGAVEILEDYAKGGQSKQGPSAPQHRATKAGNPFPPVNKTR